DQPRLLEREDEPPHDRHESEQADEDDRRQDERPTGEVIRDQEPTEPRHRPSDCHRCRARLGAYPAPSARASFECAAASSRAAFGSLSPSIADTIARPMASEMLG